jgi:DNA primase
MSTLTEALEKGQGVERPFRCTEHDDTMASASVNVVKGVWYCFACGAHGNVDSKRVPKVEELRAMMEPEATPRIYDPAFLMLYSDPGYWLERFPDWLCWYMGLGSDPFTGDATFPVHTAAGRLAGVGRRTETGEPKYKYPHNWSAASSLFGMGGKSMPVPVLCLVEGAADASACWEVGCPALAVYGSGIHRPQYELIARCNPSLVLLGFDNDEAGALATERAFHAMTGVYDRIFSVDWFPRKDPAALAPQERREALLEAVRTIGYSRGVVDIWDHNEAEMRSDFFEHRRNL